MFCCLRPKADAGQQGAHGSAPTNPSTRCGTTADVDFGTLTELYEPINLLGSGAYGDTYLMIERSSQRRVAVKVIPRPIPKVMAERVETEIVMQSRIGAQCHGVVEAYDAVLTDRHLALVMELADGGSLTDFVTKRMNKKTLNHQKLFMSEKEACYFYRQFISALDVCHSNHIAHRDLKLDNTLLTAEDPPRLRLCDFGFAKSWGHDPAMHTLLGTPEYMSPDQAKNANAKEATYDARASDVWSSGIVLFVMLEGFFPFEVSETTIDRPLNQQLLEVWGQQLNDKWWKARHIAGGWALLSEDCQDLLKRIFVVETSQRIRLEEIKEHSWFKQKLPEKFERALEDVAIVQQNLDSQAKVVDPTQLYRRADRLNALVQAASLPSHSEESDKFLEEHLSKDTFDKWLQVKKAALPLRDLACVSLTPESVRFQDMHLEFAQ